MAEHRKGKSKSPLYLVYAGSTNGDDGDWSSVVHISIMKKKIKPFVFSGRTLRFPTIGVYAAVIPNFPIKH